MKIFFLLIFSMSIALACSAKGQTGNAPGAGRALVDSLAGQLENNTLPEQDRANILTSLCLEYVNIAPDKGIEYGLQAEKLARSIGYNTKMGEIYLGLSWCYGFYNDLAQSYSYSLKAVKWCKESKNADVLLIAEISSYARNQNIKREKEIALLDSAMLRLNTCKDVTWHIRTVGALGNTYGEIGVRGTADSLLHIALAEAQKENRQFLEFHCLTRIAMILYGNDKFQPAVDLFKKVNVYLLSIGEQRLRCENEYFLSRCYLQLFRADHDPQKISEAKAHGRSSVAIADNIGYTMEKLFIYATLREIFVEQHNMDSAYFYLQKSMDINEQLWGRPARMELEQITVEQKDEIAAKEMKIEEEKLHRRNALIYFTAALSVVSLILLFTIFRYYSRKAKASMLLHKEQEKSEKLLLNILPAEVAEELKNTGKSTAKHYDNVTVLFTDFANFTVAAEKMTPQELINELQACFTSFDTIVDKHKIEKIKTIGDAYLAVCGLPVENPEHAVNVVKAAIEIRDFMKMRKAQLGDATFDIRIGINSGSVVAGIVGVRKFAYDIWGDTVNTAARMEQSCEAGKINVSQTTYELIKDKFECESRGEIDAKNKGKMKMYYVV